MTPEEEAEQTLLARFDGIGVFLAGPANVVMQLAWPEVGYGVLESRVPSGSIKRHPFKRFRTTVAYLDIALRGSEEMRAAYREAINKQHRQVFSTPESPVRYNAFSRDLQLWVASCLYYGTRDAHVTLHGPMTEQEEELLLRACGRYGTTLQMPAELWHPDRASFERYWEAGVERITIDPPVREFLDYILAAQMLPFPLDRLLGPALLWANTGFLPAPFRDAMGLEWSATDERAFRLLTRTLGRTISPLPSSVRLAPIALTSADVRLRRKLGLSLT